LKLKEKKEFIHPPQESCWLILLKGVTAHDVSGSWPSSLEPAGWPAGAGVAAPKSLARMRTVPPLPSWTHCRSLPAGCRRRVQRSQID
jgi:hypothetical protein